MPIRYDTAAFPTHKEREAAKRILCAIIQGEGNGNFSGMTRLYKAFYWAHLYFWQNFSGMLTTYPIARMPRGPGIDAGEDLLFEMQHQGLIRVEVTDDPDFPERRFQLIAKFKINLSPEEERAVQHGLEKIRGKTAKQVSEETHRESRSWRRLSNGKIMNIYEDLLSDPEATRVQNRSAEIKNMMDKVFAG